MGKFSKTMYLDGGGSITLRRASNGGTTITLNVSARTKPPVENELSVTMTQEETAELSAATREESSPGWA